MNDLVQFESVLPVASDKEFPVDARDLHKALRVGKDFSTWIKSRLQETDAVEGKEFSPNLGKTSNPSGGRPSKEYHLTIQLAKEFSMLERNEVGKQVRRYFIACEEKLRAEPQLDNKLWLKKELLASIEREEKLELEKQKVLEENTQLKPKAERWAAFMTSEGTFTFESAAKILKTGQNRLFKLLRNEGYLFRTMEKYNTPYQPKVDAGYFVVKVKTFSKGDKEVNYPQVFITPKGLEHLIKKYFNPLDLAV